MNFKKIFTGLFVLLVVFAVSPEVAAQKVLLRLDLNEGDTYSYVNAVDQTITQDIMGMNQVIKQEITFHYDATVVEKMGDDYKIKYTYTRAIFNMDGGPMMGVTEYDSDNEDEEVAPMARGYAGLIGQSFTATMNSQGEIGEVEGVSAMLDNMMEQFGDMPDTEKANIRTSMEAQFGDEGIKSTIQAASPSFPEKKMKVGKPWESEDVLQSGFKMNKTSTFVITSASDSEVAIDIDATLVSDPESSMETNGMNLNYDVTGDATGNQVLDRTSGMVKTMTLDQNMTGEVTATGGMMGDGMTWPITIESKTTITLVE